MELQIFQGHLNTTDRIVNAFKTAAASARRDGKPLNTLYLLAALDVNGLSLELRRLGQAQFVCAAAREVLQVE